MAVIQLKMTEKTAISSAKDTWKNNGRFDVSVKMKEYKCFRDEYVGFDRIMPINVIIGRNNSGKSALLDMVQAICSEPPTYSQDMAVLSLAHPLRFPTDSTTTFEYIININDCECSGIHLQHQNPNTSFHSPQQTEASMFKFLQDHKFRVVFQTNQNKNQATNIHDKVPDNHYARECNITIKTKANPFTALAGKISEFSLQSEFLCVVML